MELAVFAAGIAIRWQIGKQRRVEVAPAETGVELLRVDATQNRAIAALDEITCEAIRVFAPERI